jgi:hypothetical protein
MATSGDFYLATSGDFFMATDTETPDSGVRGEYAETVRRTAA